MGTTTFFLRFNDLKKPKIPENTDILLSHGPAFGHQDVARLGGEHLGSKTLVKRIDSLKIPYVICGHIRGGYGVEKTNDTTYINCSVLNEDYKLVNEPVVFDL